MKHTTIALGLLLTLSAFNAQAGTAVYMNKAIECYDAKDTSAEPQAVLNIGIDHNYYHELYKCEELDELSRKCKALIDNAVVAATLSTNSDLDQAEGYDTYTVASKIQMQKGQSIQTKTTTKMFGKPLTLGVSLTPLSETDEEGYKMKGSMTISYNDDGEKVKKSVQLKCENGLLRALNGD